MSAWFITGIIVFILFVIAAIGVGFTYHMVYDTENGRVKVSHKPWSKHILLTGFLLFGIMMIPACAAITPTRNVGVGTTFSKPTGETYSAGLNWKSPLVNVTDIDATIQTEEYKGDRAIAVRIADGGTAYISMTYRWRINPDGADTIYQDYRNSELDLNDSVQKALVSTNIKASINEALASYDPLATTIPPNATAEDLANLKINVVPDYEQINADIEANFAKKIEAVGDLIDVQQITVSYVRLPDGTQKRINEFLAAVQRTKTAIQNEATAAATARANSTLAASLADNSLGVVQSRCLDTVAEAIENKYPLPAGFNCVGASGAGIVATK